MPDRTYRFVGGELHGTLRHFGGKEAITFEARPDLSLPLRPQSVVAYVERAIGSRKTEARPFDMRVDVMLAADLAERLDADPNDGEVAWQVLDAFMIDFPEARRLGDNTALKLVRTSFEQALAALKRAERALGKEPPRDHIRGTARWYAQSGVNQITRVLDVLAGAPAVDTEGLDG